MRYQRPRQGLGSVADVVTLAVDTLTNPYVPEILCRVKQIEATHKGQPVPACTTTPYVVDSLGIGKFMPVARGYAYAEQHKWAYAVAALVVVGVPFTLGYFLGKK